MDNHSSLLQKFVNYGQKSFITLGNGVNFINILASLQNFVAHLFPLYFLCRLIKLEQTPTSLLLAQLKTLPFNQLFFII
jgi:hypothetical protein